MFCLFQKQSLESCDITLPAPDFQRTGRSYRNIGDNNNHLNCTEMFNIRRVYFGGSGLLTKALKPIFTDNVLAVTFEREEKTVQIKMRADIDVGMITSALLFVIGVTIILSVWCY